MPDRTAATPQPVRPPQIAPLELERLRATVHANLFDKPTALPTVGRYTLLRCIGHGGMGIVYAAHDQELAREVAIKVLRADIAGADDRRLADEARALARLAHPNVVGVYDVGVHAGQRFIAMEYVVGEDLRRWLAAPRTLREILRVFAGAGRGLGAAHAVGLVHRDFKPDNVLVGDDGRPRVLDFGLAQAPTRSPVEVGRPPLLATGADPTCTALSAAGEVIGTPAYMAPEQYLGEAADARSDQFSYAVALYFAVYGERPFAGDDPQALALSIVRGRVRPFAPRYPVPAWLDALLERALRVEPAGRFASMDALVAILDGHIEAVGAAELDALPSRSFVPDRRIAASTSSDRGALVSNDPWAADGTSAIGADTLARVNGSAIADGRARPPEERGDGTITSLSTRRAIGEPLSEAALDRLTRELDRLEGTRGKIVRLGAGLTWSTPALEVHVDLDRDGTQLLVWRRLGSRLRRRAAGWTSLGFLGGALAIPVAEAFGSMGGGFEVAVVLGLLGGGAFIGLRTAHDRHAAALPARRAELEFIADRLLVVAGAPPPMLEAAD